MKRFYNFRLSRENVSFIAAACVSVSVDVSVSVSVSARSSLPMSDAGVKLTPPSSYGKEVDTDTSTSTSVAVVSVSSNPNATPVGTTSSLISSESATASSASASGSSSSSVSSSSSSPPRSHLSVDVPSQQAHGNRISDDLDDPGHLRGRDTLLNLSISNTGSFAIGHPEFFNVNEGKEAGWDSDDEENGLLREEQWNSPVRQQIRSYSHNRTAFLNSINKGIVGLDPIRFDDIVKCVEYLDQQKSEETGEPALPMPSVYGRSIDTLAFKYLKNEGEGLRRRATSRVSIYANVPRPDGRGQGQGQNPLKVHGESEIELVGNPAVVVLQPAVAETETEGQTKAGESGEAIAPANCRDESNNNGTATPPDVTESPSPRE